MAFTIPKFNLLCDIWRGNTAPPVGDPALAEVPCQLAWDRAADYVITVGANRIHPMKLRVPAGTDLRGQLSSTFQDTVEIPSGSGRYYTCWMVDDVAKGFSNEYRQGLVFAVVQPTPLP